MIRCSRISDRMLDRICLLYLFCHWIILAFMVSLFLYFIRFSPLYCFILSVFTKCYISIDVSQFISLRLISQLILFLIHYFARDFCAKTREISYFSQNLLIFVSNGACHVMEACCVTPLASNDVL